MCAFTSKKVFALEKAVGPNQKIFFFEEFVGVNMCFLLCFAVVFCYVLHFKQENILATH